MEEKKVEYKPPAEAIDTAQETLKKIEPENPEPKKEKKKLSLAAQIFIAMVLAIIVGLCMQNVASVADSYIKPFGTIFHSVNGSFDCGTETNNSGNVFGTCSTVTFLSAAVNKIREENASAAIKSADSLRSVEFVGRH